MDKIISDQTGDTIFRGGFLRLTRPPTKRFFRSLKHERLNCEKFKTQEMAKLNMIDYSAFTTTADHARHWAVNPRSNSSGIFQKRCLSRYPVFIDHYTTISE
jgi:hypothetical protein